ncbi:hypothetical protein LNQ52_02820 [Klebsiella pneumoniae subsp. pneumoniae]|nr:hypothetical protein [Klebsiella pneumoniae subsp. pneumoniae]
MLGDKDGYIFFKMASDKVTFKEVVSAYNTLTLPAMSPERTLSLFTSEDRT